MRVGFFLSCEEYGPLDLLRQARAAEEAGFEGLWISDHFHPWNDEQGQSAFVWSVIGALSQVTERIPVTTAVTCPTLRIHPAIMAQAAATSATMLPGRFRFGVGTGEALNEHILADHWPSADVRLEMLEESIELIRELWTGRQVEHYGTHYAVENARIYTLPEELPPILVSGFGPKAVDVAARIGDGFVQVGPDAEHVERYRSNGGGDRLVQSGTKVCWGEDEAACVKKAHRLWPNDGLPGELAQVLPTPAHFEQAAQLVTEDMIAESTVCGPDMDRHVEELQQFADAGIDEVYVQQIGGDHDGFFAAYREHVLPRFH
jgi:G6PDH family F420-dependent oxidoreductase